jgi:hypothetical protein
MANHVPMPHDKQAELQEAEKWFAEIFDPSLTQEQILKIILFKLHKLEEQNKRMNSIL